MSAYKNDRLNQARDLWQTAVTGYKIHVSAPYGTPEGTEISEQDICLIVNGTQTALDRMSEALEILAEEIDR